MTESEQIILNKKAPTKHKIYPLLRHRYSPRIFDSREIAEEDVSRLFEAVRWSASSSNLQPWRFIYAHKGTEAYDTIMDCLSDFNQKWCPNAPLLMLTAYKEKKEDGKENFHALHDLGLSLGNMTVQAQSLGIALHHMAGVDHKKAAEVFAIPDGFHVASAIAVGYYGGDIENLPEKLQEQETASRERIPQKDFAFKDRWEG